MKILIFILIISAISVLLASSYRINLNKKIKTKRAAMEFAWRIKKSVDSLNIYLREIVFIGIFIIGVILIKVVFPDITIDKIWIEGNIIQNIGLFIGVILALGTVVFMFWGGVAQGIFKVDVYSGFKGMNHLRRNKKSKIFTENIRPVIRALLEGYLYFYLLVEVLRIEGIQNELIIYSIGVIIFTLYKILIYDKWNQRILIGAWYFCIATFGYMLLGIHENMITVFFYLIVADAIWVYKQ